MYEIQNMMRDMFKDMGMFSMFPKLSNDFKFENVGLREYIRRPHNLYTHKDENGKITGYSISVVYTPAKKDDVKVTVEDNNLKVECGSENYKDEQIEDMTYHGISSQSFMFTIPLNEAVDQDGITAKADDGVLKIDIPVKKEIPTSSKVKQIEIK